MKQLKTDFSLRQVEVFARAYEMKSFARAARAVFLAQPTVSEHIAALERTLGTPLFDRLRREVVPTQAGRIFYDFAVRLLALQREAVQAVDGLTGAVRGELRLGGSTVPGVYLLPRWVRGFQKKFPGIRVSVKVGDTRAIAEEVLEGRIEAAVVGSAVSDRRLKCQPVDRDELVVAVPAGHPWSRRATVKPVELCGVPYISRERGSAQRETVERLLAEHAPGCLERLAVACEVESTEAVKEAIKAGLGVSILSAWALETELAAKVLCVLRLEGIKLERELFLIHHLQRTLAPPCRHFLAHVAAILAKGGRGQSPTGPTSPKSKV
ncbi:MAG: LysR family transcriptional regulator [Planctomycetes bacterium]|nr:LysR family transcriptional regulator [Planctomycetota bacterium]